jgi:prolyl oligopeptidase PreP (S9A serine peptidase family)
MASGWNEGAQGKQPSEILALDSSSDLQVNVFDDFIAATWVSQVAQLMFFLDGVDVRQFLVDNKYAATGKVAINGGSNGGL